MPGRESFARFFSFSKFTNDHKSFCFFPRRTNFRCGVGALATPQHLREPWSTCACPHYGTCRSHEVGVFPPNEAVAQSKSVVTRVGRIKNRRKIYTELWTLTWGIKGPRPVRRCGWKNVVSIFKSNSLWRGTFIFPCTTPWTSALHRIVNMLSDSGRDMRPRTPLSSVEGRCIIGCHHRY